MSAALHDLRHALRGLARSPGFAVVSILTLAIGIGANTTVYRWIEGLVVEPLPAVPEQGRILVASGQSRGGEGRSVSVPDYRDLARSRLPLAVTVFAMQPMSLTGGERPELVWGSLVSGNFFDVLQVRAEVGRTFRPEEDTAPGAHPVVVLADRFWRRRFQADPGIVGRTIQLDRQPFTVIGVAARGFLGGAVGLSFDLWVPLAMQRQVSPGGDRLNQRGIRWLTALARLPPGVTAAAAQAALDALFAQLGRTFPDSDDGYRLVLHHFWNAPSGASSFLLPVLAVLAVMVGLILLIACANVANLLLVRALGRRREIAVRLALGAGRGRLLRQLLTESLVLAAFAGGLGLLIALWATHLLVALVPPTDAPVGPTFALDARLFGFVALISLATAGLCSLAPAFQLASPALVTALRAAGAAVAGGGKGRLRSALVVLQIAVSAVLLTTAGLFVRSLGHAADVDPGFAARDVLLAAFDLYPNGYDEERGKSFFRQLLERVRALPGVESATLASEVPLDFGGANSTRLRIEGYQPGPQEEVVVDYNLVGPYYLRTMGIPAVAGRDFTRRDDSGAVGAMIVNETMARRYWAGRDPVGARVHQGQSEYVVVGVARDGKYQQLSEPPRPFFYLSLLQAYRSSVVVHARTRGDAAALAPALRATLRALDPNLPLAVVKTMREHLRIAVFLQRLAASFLGTFGLLALLLATVGLYSVIRYAVSQRTRELGVRVALGARPGDLVRMVVGQGMVLAGIGLALGVAVALGTTHLLASQLLGVSATDPAVFLAVAALLAAVAAFACYLPARGAAAVDPMVVLQAE
jgi:putative ABC transport system permease protein